MNDIQRIQQEFIFYNSVDGTIKVQVIVDPTTETIWATQAAMAELFQIDISGISRHINNILDSGELDRSNLQKMQIANSDKPITYYNLDMIISVGYRVNSLRATKFRIWATTVLKEYMIKGFALDDERLKAGGNIFGKEYFDELLERVQEIRASERLFYQKLTDILMLCRDYDSKSKIAQDFFACIQNKLEYAVLGQTAAEIIVSRINIEHPTLGLLTWKAYKTGGKIIYQDTTVAKNYMTPKELGELTTLVNICLDNARLKTQRKEFIFMQDWIDMVNGILGMNGYQILQGKGTVSSEKAKTIAKEKYEQFRPIQDKRFESDFDKLVERTIKKP